MTLGKTGRTIGTERSGERILFSQGVVQTTEVRDDGVVSSPSLLVANGSVVCCWRSELLVAGVVPVETLSSVPSAAVVVALLGTTHDIEVVDTPYVSVLSVGVAGHTIFIGTCNTVPAIVVVLTRIDGVVARLTGVGVLPAEVGVQVQVLEAVNLIVSLDVTRYIVGMCQGLCQAEGGDRVARSIRVGGISPVLVVKFSALCVLPVAASVLLKDSVVATDRTCRIHLQSSTYDTTITGPVVLLVSVFSCDIECQVRIEEVRREVHTAVPTVHVGLLDDTFIILIACTDTIRHVLQTTRDRQVMTSGDSGTEDFVLPVGVGCAERLENVSATELGHQVTVLVTAEHIVALLRM